MPTHLPEVGADDVLYVIDLSGYLFRAYHAIQTPLASPSGEPTHATLGTVTMIDKLVRERKPRHLVIAMDSRGPSFRKEMFDGYKATRTAPPEDLSQQVRRCREIVEAYQFQILQENGVEADDLIASCVRCARAAGMRVVIVSSDKDLMSLVGDDVVMWDTMRNKVYGPPEVEEKLGVGPAHVRDYLALTGDTSDNVPGVPSVGPKTASELLKQFGSLEGIYADVDAITKKKLKETLKEHEANARLSQKLVTLRDDIAVGVTRESGKVGRGDVGKLRSLFAGLGFTRLLQNLGEAAEAKTEAAATVAGAATGAAEAAVQMALPLGGAAATKRSSTTLAAEAEVRAFVERAKKAESVSLLVEASEKDAMRADLQTLAVAIDREEAVRIPFPLPAKDAVKALLEAESPAKIAYDAKRADVLLRHDGIALGGVSFDVLVADYLLDPERSHALPFVAEAELNETPTPGTEAAVVLDLAAGMLPRLESEGLFSLLRDVELPLSATLADMETTGVLVDVATLREIGKMVDEKLLVLEAEAKKIAGKDFNVASPRQLETLLFDELKLRVVKRTKTARSTDAEVLEALAEDHPLPGVILEHRMLAKLKGTYIEALPNAVNPRTGRIHTRYDQAVAATGRLSSNDPNLQNIPIRSDVGRAIRRAFVAPPGNVLLSADYSQIELRVLAHLSRDPVLVDAFTTGQDIHERTAMEIFEKAEGAVTPDERRAAKTVNFGVIYGMGDSALAKRLGIPRKEAASFIQRYFQRYAGVRRYFDGVLATARQTQSVSTTFGRRRFVPDINSANRAVRLAAERVAQNTPIQGSAADILKKAMVKLRAPVVEGSRMILTVHDELVFEVPDGRVDEAAKRVKQAMETVVDFAVPLVVDVGHGRTWADAKE